MNSVNWWETVSIVVINGLAIYFMIYMSYLASLNFEMAPGRRHLSSDDHHSKAVGWYWLAGVGSLGLLASVITGAIVESAIVIVPIIVFTSQLAVSYSIARDHDRAAKKKTSPTV